MELASQNILVSYFLFNSKLHCYPLRIWTFIYFVKVSQGKQMDLRRSSKMDGYLYTGNIVQGQS